MPCVIVKKFKILEEIKMNNTALRAGNKKVLFISEAHENFYNEKLNMVRYKDVLTKCLSEGWQTSGS